MNLQEAIRHCEEKTDCTECGKEHMQLVEWLKEYENLKELNMAKKPNGLSINMESMRLGNCPNCNKLLADKFDEHHCECGQRIDWT